MHDVDRPTALSATITHVATQAIPEPDNNQGQRALQHKGEVRRGQTAGGGRGGSMGS